jgi:hypothetical protein
VRTPTAEAPLRLFMAGDSMGIAFGGALARQAGATGLIAATYEARGSSGLTRPDYFDWRARLARALEEDQPEVVVLMFGANDSQGIRAPDGAVFQTLTDGWRAEYRRRVAAVMDMLVAPGRLVIWVGQPIMASSGLSERMADINTIYREEAALRAEAGVLYLDSWPLFTGPDGEFETYLPDADGEIVQVRAGDGIHLARAGAEHLARAVLERLDTEADVLR